MYIIQQNLLSQPCIHYIYLKKTNRYSFGHNSNVTYIFHIINNSRIYFIQLVAVEMVRVRFGKTYYFEHTWWRLCRNVSCALNLLSTGFFNILIHTNKKLNFVPFRLFSIFIFNLKICSKFVFSYYFLSRIWNWEMFSFFSYNQYVL